MEEASDHFRSSGSSHRRPPSPGFGVAGNPGSVSRVLRAANLLCRWNQKDSQRGTGFQEPTRPHEHWYGDISYLQMRCVFYSLIRILDGYSRYLVHWEIRITMISYDGTIVIQRAKERFEDVAPRILSDRGSQFVVKYFKAYIRHSEMSPVMTWPYYPQSNGKKERWYRTAKREGVRQSHPLTLDKARRIVAGFMETYNPKRLHSSLGYVMPSVQLEGREHEIVDSRDRKLEAVWAQRK